MNFPDSTIDSLIELVWTENIDEYHLDALKEWGHPLSKLNMLEATYEPSKALKNRYHIMVCFNILLNTSFTVPYKCPSCPATFEERRLLETHYELTHGDGIARFCFRCGKGFATSQSYQRHCQSVHEQRKPVRNHACEQCNMAFASTQALKTHITRKHPGHFLISLILLPSRGKG
ncbi:unnamed protein product [Rodentolepis nana]|uniref:C2H2-type domain-containing protein n=1 Tax=Rodentolepis nana TaxID=102285 RepID=A0A0R3T8E2_RODNA|nr:unnamed protein product [Rodentolepis nana]